MDKIIFASLWDEDGMKRQHAFKKYTHPLSGETAISLCGAVTGLKDEKGKTLTIDEMQRKYSERKNDDCCEQCVEICSQNYMSEKIMLQYFGTDLRNAGHYHFDLLEGSMRRITETMWHKSLPFDAYYAQTLQRGQVHIGEYEEYQVCIIGGSCTDDRNGTVSAFYTKEKVNNWEEVLKNHPMASKIINQISFEIQWPA